MTEKTYVTIGFPVVGWMGCCDRVLPCRDRKRTEQGILCRDRGFCVMTENSHRDGLLCRDRTLFVTTMGHDAASQQGRTCTRQRCSIAHDRAGHAHDKFMCATEVFYRDRLV